MFFNKKGQTATEYLIILAVVIVVALIVVGVMGGIPGIGQGVGTKASAAYWKSTDVAVDSYSVSDSSGDVTLIVRNNMASSIDITNFTLGTDELTGFGILTPGQTATLTGAGFTCDGSFSYDVAITYVDQATSAEYTLTGDGHKLEGTCAN